MEYKGKIFVGIAGIFIGDIIGLPFGAATGFILGSLIGHFFIDVPREGLVETDEFKAYKRRQGMYLYHVFTLCARMAKVDGAVNSREVNHMELLMTQQFKLSGNGRAHAIDIWNKAKTSPETFEYLALNFYKEFQQERHQVLNMLDLLFAVAASDGNLHPAEENLLLRTAGLFHIGRMQYDRIKSRYYQPPPSQQMRWTPLDPYYAILGAEPHDSLDTIKKKFRKLAIQWHPDKVAARTISPEVMRHAQEKFQQINDAYGKIMAARQTRP